jgi:hypothetical protein
MATDADNFIAHRIELICRDLKKDTQTVHALTRTALLDLHRAKHAAQMIEQLDQTLRTLASHREALRLDLARCATPPAAGTDPFPDPAPPGRAASARKRVHEPAFHLLLNDLLREWSTPCMYLVDLNDAPSSVGDMIKRRVESSGPYSVDVDRKADLVNLVRAAHCEADGGGGHGGAEDDHTAYLEFLEWLEASATRRNDYATFLQTRQLHRPEVIINWLER